MKSTSEEISLKEIRYLDIGANHPSRLSNTMYFYSRGGFGVLIEPNPVLAKLLQNRRPKDKVIAAGVASKASNGLEFHLMKPDVLSTFSRQSIENYQRLGFELEKTLEVPVLAIEDVIREHFQFRSPHIFSLDVEGLDFEILTAIDWQSFSPIVICAETWDMGSKTELSNVIDFIKTKGYRIFAKAGPNTVFLRNLSKLSYPADGPN